ncbi:MAG: SpoVA/SpoVAEb family sporulation membrane protein [Clostridia bacterium]|nr:SpoVA/SpoVAEb family sporulation membrane protein [Clostridia bacterium]
MRMSNEEYKKLYEGISPPSPSYKNIPFAFIIGGGICALAQFFKNLYLGMGYAEIQAGSMVSMTVIFIGVLLTGLGWFGPIAKRAGAGTLVPITGFANSVAAPALEFKTEGVILGTCVKMFSIAGPVLVFGISASVVYGLIYYFIS